MGASGRVEASLWNDCNTPSQRVENCVGWIGAGGQGIQVAVMAVEASLQMDPAAHPRQCGFGRGDTGAVRRDVSKAQCGREGSREEVERGSRG